MEAEVVEAGLVMGLAAHTAEVKMEDTITNLVVLGMHTQGAQEDRMIHRVQRQEATEDK
jgi:hypothetical protein